MILDIIVELIKSYLAIVIIWLLTFVVVLITLAKRKDMIIPIKIFWGFIIFIAPVIGLIFYLVYGLKGKKTLLPTKENNIHDNKHGPI